MGFDLGWIDTVYTWMCWFCGKELEADTPTDEVITVIAGMFAVLLFVAMIAALVWEIVEAFRG